jgi:uncharacterized protein YndB with AHSA1/START domain
MIRFGFAIEVARPIDDVFDYVTEPATLTEWQGTETVERLTPGPLQLGSRLREVRLILGRRLESLSEVVAYERPRRFEIRILSGPMPVADRWAFEPTVGGTRLVFSTEGSARGVLRAAEPLIAAVLERRRRTHHDRLKRVLETPGADV